MEVILHLPEIGIGIGYAGKPVFLLRGFGLDSPQALEITFDRGRFFAGFGQTTVQKGNREAGISFEGFFDAALVCFVCFAPLLRIGSFEVALDGFGQYAPAAIVPLRYFGQKRVVANKDFFGVVGMQVFEQIFQRPIFQGIGREVIVALLDSREQLAVVVELPGEPRYGLAIGQYLLEKHLEFGQLFLFVSLIVQVDILVEAFDFFAGFGGFSSD